MQILYSNDCTENYMQLQHYQHQQGVKGATDVVSRELFPPYQGLRKNGENIVHGHIRPTIPKLDIDYVIMCNILLDIEENLV